MGKDYAQSYTQHVQTQCTPTTEGNITDLTLKSPWVLLQVPVFKGVEMSTNRYGKERLRNSFNSITNNIEVTLGEVLLYQFLHSAQESVVFRKEKGLKGQ
jgi:hypothetical protein